MTSNSNGDKELADADQAFMARQAVRDLDSRYIRQSLLGNRAAASAVGDQAKAALQAEEALKRRAKPAQHRK